MYELSHDQYFRVVFIAGIVLFSFGWVAFCVTGCSFSYLVRLTYSEFDKFMDKNPDARGPLVLILSLVCVPFLAFGMLQLATTTKNEVQIVQKTTVKPFKLPHTDVIKRRIAGYPNPHLDYTPPTPPPPPQIPTYTFLILKDGQVTREFKGLVVKPIKENGVWKLNINGKIAEIHSGENLTYIWAED